MKTRFASMPSRVDFRPTGSRKSGR